MPIPISCPHCQKLYRLKDELAGKTVKCQNADCRKPFPVPVPKSAAEVEADALRALGDEADQPTDDRVIPITCEMCEHKWNVPWAMQGKNVLCPECRHRNKVPVQKQKKAADWKTGGGKPSMARVEELEGVVASTDVSRVSGEALRKGGAVVDLYEPRPTSFWLLYVGLPLLGLLVLGYGVSSFFRGKSDKREAHFVDIALKDQEEAKDAPVPPSEVPLFRGALAVAAGEYFGRLDDPAKLTEAVKQFARARQELDGAPASVARTLLLGELAVAQVGLGGSDDEATTGTRIRWAPGGRMKLNEKQYTVQTELSDTLAALNRPDKIVNPSEKHALARRLVRRAVEMGQPAILDAVIPKLFTDAEAAEGQAVAALEGLKATGDAEAAKRRAAELAPLAAGGSGPYLQALVLAVGPIPGLNQPAPASATPGEAARLAHTAALLIAKNGADAVDMAKRDKNPNNRNARAVALALVAEWADDPKPAVDEAAMLLAENAPNIARIPDPILIRFAAAAGRAGAMDKADLFIKAVDKPAADKPDSKSWAQAEAVRGRLLTGPADDTMTKLPEDAKDNRSGLAWQLLTVARHTARTTRSTDAANTYDRWGNGVFRPFGYAGMALGLQDAKK